MQATVDAAEAQAWLGAPAAPATCARYGRRTDPPAGQRGGRTQLATEQLRRLGGQGVSSLAGGICHILVGPRRGLSQALQPLLRR